MTLGKSLKVAETSCALTAAWFSQVTRCCHKLHLFCRPEQHCLWETTSALLTSQKKELRLREGQLPTTSHSGEWESLAPARGLTLSLSPPQVARRERTGLQGGGRRKTDRATSQAVTA